VPGVDSPIELSRPREVRGRIKKDAVESPANAFQVATQHLQEPPTFYCECDSHEEANAGEWIRACERCKVPVREIVGKSRVDIIHCIMQGARGSERRKEQWKQWKQWKQSKHLPLEALICSPYEAKVS